MTRFGKAGATALLCVSLLGAAQFAHADMASDRAAIRDLWNSYQTARVAGDAESWLALWDDEGIQMPPGRHARGLDALKVGVPKAFVAVPATMMEITPEEITIMGDWAYSRGTYLADQIVNGEPTTIVGKFLTIHKRQADGSWRIYRDIFNDSPPE